MNRTRAILALILGVFVAAFILGCDSETTGPRQAEQGHVDPIDWDGDKETCVGSSPGRVGSDETLRGPAGTAFGVHERILGSDLRPHDHTIIMEAILRNLPEIAAQLPQNQVSSESAVLEAAYGVPAIDAYTKSRIRLVLSLLPRLKQAQGLVPEETQQALARVLERLEDCQSVAESIDALQSMIDSGQYEEYDGLPQGLATGIRILRDGERTVYSPRCLLNFKRLIRQDLAGAIGGAIGGAIVGGPGGAGVGAIAGSAGASGADIVGQLTGWW